MIVLAVAAAVLHWAVTPPEKPVSSRAGELSAEDFAADFDALWKDVSENYAYFDSRAAEWAAIPSLYKADLAAVKTREEFIGLLEEVLDELHDPHAQLTVNTPRSPRLVPSGADIWAEWKDGKAIVVEVRRDSDAQRAGIRAGAEIVTLNGAPIADAARRRAGRSAAGSDAARGWALRAALAGRHNEERRVSFRQEGRAAEATLAAADQFTARGARLTSDTLDGGIGYVRINDSLGDSRVVPEFDAALARLGPARALILDLRDTPSGGNTSVARGILGRFVRSEKPYQKHVLPSEERETGIRRSWLELVTPREPAWTRPVAVLVGHWTGSMGEGLAIGFDGTGAGTVVGAEMARLRGATYHFALPRSGIGVNVPAERLYHVNGAPREAFVPGVAVEPAQPRASSGDPWIEKALSVLR